MTGSSLRLAPHQAGLPQGLPRLVEGDFTSKGRMAGGGAGLSAEGPGEFIAGELGALPTSPCHWWGPSESGCSSWKELETTDRGGMM